MTLIFNLFPHTTDFNVNYSKQSQSVLALQTVISDVCTFFIEWKYYFGCRRQKERILEISNMIMSFKTVFSDDKILFFDINRCLQYQSWFSDNCGTMKDSQLDQFSWCHCHLREANIFLADVEKEALIWGLFKLCIIIWQRIATRQTWRCVIGCIICVLICHRWRERLQNTWWRVSALA